MATGGNCEVLTLETRESWDAAYARVPESSRCVYTGPDYLAFIAQTYGYHAELVVFEHALGAVVHPRLVRPLDGLTIVDDTMTGWSDAISSWYFGGPYVIPTNPDDARALASAFVAAYTDDCAARRVVCEFLRFDPNRETHADFAGALDVQENRETVWVNLDQSGDEIVRGYREACRRGIRQAQEAGLTVEPSDAESDWAAFAAIYQEEMNRKDAPGHLRFDESFFARARTLPDSMTLLVARDGDTVAGGFIVAHGYGIGHHFLSASRTEYWDKRVNNLLFHEAIQWSKRQGLERFDFQGGRDGVFRFKKNFSRARGTFYTARVIHDADRYDALIAAHAAKHGAAPDSDFFPAYRRLESA